MLAGGDFDDADDLSLFPSDIKLFFIDSTSGLFPSLGALNEKLGFCPNDSAHRASNELNIDIIMIETQIKEVGSVCFFFFCYKNQATNQRLYSVFLRLDNVCFLRFQGKGLFFFEGFLLGLDWNERERGEMRGI